MTTDSGHWVAPVCFGQQIPCLWGSESTPNSAALQKEIRFHLSKHCKVHFILQLVIFGLLVIILLISILKKAWCCGYLYVDFLGIFLCFGSFLLLLFLRDTCGSFGFGRLGRARSQPERLLVLRIYLLRRSVYIFMLDVKVQRLSLQASVGAPVNRAGDRCEPAASSGSIRREPPRLTQLHLAVPGALCYPSLGHLPEGAAGRAGCGSPCLLHPVLFAERHR